MKRKRVVYVVSDVDKALAFEWIGKHLDRSKFDLTFFLIGNKKSKLAEVLGGLSVACVEFTLRNKRDVIKVFFQVLIQLWKKRPDVIHTHLFYANLIGLTTGLLSGVRKRIYTRHHAMVHYHDYPQGLKWDKFMNRIATHIVAISENTRHILVDLDQADVSKVITIQHGFDLSYFSETTSQDKFRMVEKYKLEGRGPVIGVISRYMEWKGVQYIIPAFKNLLRDCPKAHLVLANTVGSYKIHIQNALHTLPPGSFTEIEFENDLAALYRAFDVYVHVPVDAESEAFGQTYIEALAVGIPSVFTLSGVSTEFIVNGMNALVVDYKQADQITEAIGKIIRDDQLRDRLIANGKKSVQRFSLDTMIAKLTELYG